MSSDLEMFACTVYSCRLSRGACAERHREASKSPREHTYGPTLRWSRCGECEVGAAHARGDRPDVDVAALVRREEVEVPKITMVEHEGVTKPLSEWATEAGLGRETLRKRLDGGMSMSEALAKPVTKGGRPPSAQPSEAAAQKRAERARKAEPKPDPAPKRRPIADAVKLGKSIERAQANARARAAGDDVREMLTQLSPAELLTRLGYPVEDAGIVPAGRLLLVRGAV